MILARFAYIYTAAAANYRLLIIRKGVSRGLIVRGMLGRVTLL